MPFVKLSYDEAINILEDEDEIQRLLKQKKINPYEFRILKTAQEISNGNTQRKDELKELCDRYFPDEAEEAIKLLQRFIKSDQKRVPWVLFSRTFQLIPYQEKNPLEGYLPIKDEIIFFKIKENIVRK